MGAWSVPVVRGVVLPAHAQTSNTTIVTDSDQDGPLADRTEAAFFTFDGEIPINVTSLRFNCCDISNIPNTLGDGLFIIDFDFLNTEGCRGPFIDFSDDINGLSKIGDTNWEIRGLEPEVLSQGVYNFQAVRLNSPNEGMVFSVQIEFQVRSISFDDELLDCDGMPTIADARGSVRTTVSLPNSLPSKSASIEMVFEF